MDEMESLKKLRLRALRVSVADGSRWSEPAAGESKNLRLSRGSNRRSPWLRSGQALRLRRRSGACAQDDRSRELG